jgi:class 3 adenylate cyclase/predicted ATPase
MDSMPAWLHRLGLERYVEVFADNDVDLEAVRLLGESDLEKLGISLGHRKRLLKAIAELDGVEAPAAQATVAPTGRRASDTEAAPGVITTEAGERRQLTVLFCDMVAFTELANRVDPEVLQRIIRSYEDACAVCITRYEGYVFQRLGDGIVAFFGYPLAHEGEAERAIRAGLEIIESLARLDVPDAGHLQVRIGIATGLVVVSSAEKGAVGETMNLASRLQGIARPGNIVVSERVHRLAGGSFEYQDLGEQALKGIAQPTHAYRIVGVSEAASRFEASHSEAGLTPLVGREQEIGLLLERWALAQDGEGQVVLLSGEPGIGKSRILSALRERLEAQGAQALRFQCSPYYVNSAFWPSIDNFERALKFGRDEPPESKLDKLEALMVAHYGRPLGDVRFIASMLSIPCDDRYGAISMTPQKQKDETLRSLVDLTETAARKQPSVMLFEDAHWADPTTLEVLDLLVDRVKGFPLLIVLTHRPEFQSRWGAHGHVTGFNLSKLTRAQSSAMVSRLAGGKALPAALLEQILAKTDGVPLFVEELTKAILESGELQDAGDRYEYTGAARTITIPATLRDSLMARLDRSPSAKELAQIGAAIGREFSYELIAAVTPTTKGELDQALQQLTESGLAFRRGTPPEATYTFKHALVQDVAYDSLLKSRRQELHAAVAQIIEERFPDVRETDPELLAHHCARANRVQDAITYRLRAGEKARTRSAYSEAQAQFNEGLQLLQILPSSELTTRAEIDLLTALGPVLMATEGQGSNSVKILYERARELCASIGEEKQMFGVTFNFWTTKFLCGELPLGRALSAELLTSAAALNDPGLMVQAQHTSWATNTWSGNLRTALRASEEGRRLYDPVRDTHHKFLYGGHDPLCCANAFRAYAMWLLGYQDSAALARDETYREMLQLGHPFTLALIGTIAMQIYYLEGDIERFADASRSVLEISERNGFPVTLAWAKVCSGWTLSHHGNAEGLGLMDAAIGDIRKLNLLTQLPFYLGLQANALWTCNSRSAALACIDQALARASSNDEHCFEPELYRMKGEMLLDVDNPQWDAAQNCFLNAIRVSRQSEARSLELRTSTSLARLWQTQGKRNAAHDLLAPIYAWFTEGLDTKDLTEAKALLEELTA